MIIGSILFIHGYPLSFIYECPCVVPQTTTFSIGKTHGTGSGQTPNFLGLIMKVMRGKTFTLNTRLAPQHIDKGFHGKGVEAAIGCQVLPEHGLFFRWKFALHEGCILLGSILTVADPQPVI